jgi:3-oxoadipate enol-lactonase
MPFSVNYIDQGPTDGTAIIFLHGIGGDSHSWDFQLENFSNDYRTIAWDMPGYGGSPLIDPMTFESLSDSLIRMMDHLKIKQTHLVGHSMGGMVAQQAIATSPDRFKSLILSATSPAFGKADGDFQKQFVAARLKPLEDGLAMKDLAKKQVPAMVGDNPNPKGLALAYESMSKVSPETFIASMHCLVTFDRRDNLSLIDLPTLLVAGEKDTNAPAPMMEKMASKIRNSSYVCIAGAGHLSNMERPEEFDVIIRNFIKNNS